MGKKDKGEKKKGPLKKLSKCLFFWGSKRKSSKELKQESPLKRAYSESSVANTLRSENTAPTTDEQDLDSANAGECSSSSKHFQFYCDISDTIEQEATGNSMPDFKLQQNEKFIGADLQDSTKPNNMDLNIESCKPDENDKRNDELDNGKLRRFTVTAVSNANDNDIGNVYTKELEVTVSPKSEVKELKKSLLCQSSFNSDDEKHIEPQICQPNVVSNCSSNKETFSQAKNFRERFISSNDNALPAEKANCQLNLVPHNYTNNIEVNHSESSICQSNYSSQFSTSNIGEKQSEQSIFQSSLNSANSTSNVNTKHPEQLACQDNFGSISYIKNAAQHSEPQICQQNSSGSYKNEIVSLCSEPQISQHNFNLSNLTDDTNDQLQIDTTKIRATDQRIKIDVQHLESQKFEDMIIYEGQSSSNFVNCTIDSLETERLPVDRKKQHVIDSLEKRDMAIVIATNNENSSQSDSNLDNDTSHSIFDDGKNNGETTTTNEASNFDFSINNENFDTIDKLIPSLEAEEPNICLNNESSSSHDSSQPFDTTKNSENSLRVTNDIGNSSHITKCGEEYLENKNQAQLVESYPSISVIKGTSEIGMTLVVLPYINSAGDNGNWKVLSDLTVKGNHQSGDVGKSLNIDENKDAISNNEADMQEVLLPSDEKSVEECKSNTLTKSTKSSRLPVRKLAEPGYIVDKISRLSMEIEELNSNIKQKSVDNSKSNSPNKSISRIPRKCS